LVNRDGRHRPEFIASFLPVLVFLPGTAVALFAPQYAQYFWFRAFGALFARRFFTSPAEAR
jgi:TMEM175 potassium channel family protein